MRYLVAMMALAGCGGGATVSGGLTASYGDLPAGFSFQATGPSTFNATRTDPDLEFDSNSQVGAFRL